MSDQDFESIFDGKEPTEPQAPAEPETAPETAQATQDPPQGEQPEPAKAEDGEGAPPAPESGKNVPLSALEAVRREKTDWKEKAIRYEEQLRQLREAPPAQPQQQVPQREPTPQELLINERMNMSEMIARKDHEDMDEKLAAFEEAVQKNPALRAELLQQRHPWEWVYQQGARMLALKEIGDDPAQYRERVRQELLAELQAQNQPPAQLPAPAAQAAAVPTSLATARSSASRSAPAFTGPRSFDDLFKQ